MSQYIHTICHLKHPFTLFWALSGIIWLSSIPPPLPLPPTHLTRYFCRWFLYRNYLGNQITRFIGRTMDQFKKENMKTLTPCRKLCFQPRFAIFFCEWHEMYKPPIRFVSVLNFRLVYFSIYNWKINLGCNFSCGDIALKKIQKCCADECPLIKIMQIRQKIKLRRMFNINKTHVIATTISMLIYDIAGYKCTLCEKPRVPIHLVSTIEVCLIK